MRGGAGGHYQGVTRKGIDGMGPVSLVIESILVGDKR